MIHDNPFAGTIDLIDDDASTQTIYKYNQSPKNDLSIDQTFISCFKGLGLTHEEKQVLSVKDRTVIHHYQRLNKDLLLNLADQLICSIEKKCSNSDILIQAEHLGAFICLAAIYSGKLPHNKHIEFRLGNAPFKLFPKTLANRTLPLSGRYAISFYVDEKCWLNNIFSLQDPPKGFESIYLEKKSA